MQGMILGCVLAGGNSTRFGSDKALAELDGHTLIARAVDTLSGWCEYVVVAGRETAPAPTVPDSPGPGMGPLGGIAAALQLARDEGYAAVLTCGVDSTGLPENLLALLSPEPAYVADQPVIGLWPASALEAVDTILKGDERHSMFRFVEVLSARAVTLPSAVANINTRADLAALEGRRGF